MSAAVRRRHAALTAIDPTGKCDGVGEIRQVLAQAPAVRRKRRVLGLVDAHFVARIGAILRHERIGGYGPQEGGLIEVHERIEGRERLRAAVDIRSAGVQRLVGRPWAGRDGTAVRTDLEQFVTGFEGLPYAGAGIAQRLGAVRHAAMGGVGQRWPVERNEGAPGEIVEVGKRIDPGRGHILDAIGRNDWRDILGCGRANRAGRPRDGERGERDRRSTRPRKGSS